MTTLTIKLNPGEVRLMKKSEAAKYLRVPVNQFPKVCPVRPVSLGALGIRYDRYDLDAWVDGLKAGVAQSSKQEALDRL